MRRPLKRLLAAVCFLLLLDSLAWLFAERLLERRLDTLGAQAAESGWHLGAFGHTRAGWPFAARLILSGPALDGPLHWSAQRAELSLSLLHPGVLTTRILGAQSLSAGEPQTRILIAHPALDNAGLLISLPGGSHPGLACFTAGPQSILLTLAGTRTALRFTTASGAVRWTRSAVSLDLRLTAVTASGPVVLPQGRADGFVEASLSDGRLLVSQAWLRWPTTVLQTSGEIQTDRDGLAQGFFTLRITNASALLAGAIHAGAVSHSAGMAIAAVLGLIGSGRPAPGMQDTETQEAGSDGTITLPITVQAGAVGLGGITLLRLPRLDPKRLLP